MATEFLNHIDEAMAGFPYILAPIFRGARPSVAPPQNYSDALNAWNVDDWIHIRFCRSYPIHHWVHSRLTRTLLLAVFCSTYTLPTLDDLVQAVSLSRALCRDRRMNEDIWNDIALYLIAENLSLWKISNTLYMSWPMNPEELSHIQRCMCLIFSDIAHLKHAGKAFIPLPLASRVIMEFLVQPELYCPADPAHSTSPFGQISDEHDSILLLSLRNSLPLLDANKCVCGSCSTTEASIKADHRSHRFTYPQVVKLSEQTGCSALVATWDPLWERAENWLDSVMHQIISPVDIFSIEYPHRLGPIIIDAMNFLGVDVSWEELPTSEFLRLMATIVIMIDRKDDAFELTPNSTFFPNLLRSDGIGYISYFQTGHEEGLPDNTELLSPPVSSLEFAIFTAGSGWLFDLAGQSADLNGRLTILTHSRDLRFSEHITTPLKLISLCMPSASEQDVPILSIPTRHSPDAVPYVSPRTVLLEHPTQIVVQADFSHESGFPLLSVAADGREEENDRPCAVALMCTYENRLIETYYRAWVDKGRACEHTTLHGHAVRCSISSHDVLRMVRYPDIKLLQKYAFKPQYQWDPDQPIQTREQSKDRLYEIQFEQKRRLSRLIEDGSIFEHQRLSIIRCGPDDGPTDPLVFIAGSLGKRVYVIHYQECWDCAIHRMMGLDCTVALAVGTRYMTDCEDCLTLADHAKSVARENEGELETLGAEVVQAILRWLA